MLMTLKAVCRKEGWGYARARYALATGKVKSAKLIGRSWMLSETDVRALRAVLAKSDHRCKTDPVPPGRKAALKRVPHVAVDRRTQA